MAFLSLTIIVVSARRMVRHIGVVSAAPYLVAVGLPLLMAAGGATLLKAVAAEGPLLIQPADFPIGSTIGTLALFAAAFIVGAAATRGRQPAVADGWHKPVVAWATQVAPGAVRRHSGGVIFFALVFTWITIGMVIVGIGGWDQVLNRPGYLEYTGPRVVLAIGNLLILAASAALGYAVSAAPRWSPARLMLYSSLLALATLTFSTGSRRLGLLAVLFWLGVLVGSQSKKKLIKWGVFAGALGFILIGVAKTSRGLPQTGLEPYLAYFMNHPEEILQSASATVANLFAPFGYIGLMSSEPPLEGAAVAAALSPLPSGMIDYYQYTSRLEFFYRHPYPAIGTLVHYGGHLWLMGYGVATGMIFGLAGRAVARLTPGLAAAGNIVLVVVVAYFTFKTMGYGLRASSRIPLYGVAATYVAFLLPAAVRNSRYQKRTSVRARSMAS